MNQRTTSFYFIGKMIVFLLFALKAQASSYYNNLTLQVVDASSSIEQKRIVPIDAERLSQMRASLIPYANSRFVFSQLGQSPLLKTPSASQHSLLVQEAGGLDNHIFSFPTGMDRDLGTYFLFMPNRLIEKVEGEGLYCAKIFEDWKELESAEGVHVEVFDENTDVYYLDSFGEWSSSLDESSRSGYFCMVSEAGPLYFSLIKDEHEIKKISTWLDEHMTRHDQIALDDPLSRKLAPEELPLFEAASLQSELSLPYGLSSSMQALEFYDIWLVEDDEVFVFENSFSILSEPDNFIAQNSLLEQDRSPFIKVYRYQWLDDLPYLSNLNYYDPDLKILIVESDRIGLTSDYTSIRVELFNERGQQQGQVFQFKNTPDIKLAFMNLREGVYILAAKDEQGQVLATTRVLVDEKPLTWYSWGI